jgi:hypothetical protein
MSCNFRISSLSKKMNGCRAAAARTVFAIGIRAALCAALLFFFLSGASAQLYTGSVTGVVTDPSGSAVPNAKVTLTDQDKGFTFNATTDNTGRYLLRSIPPGTYKLNVEAANFQSQAKDNVKLDVTQNVSVDFALKVGSSTETVEVNANAVQLQTEDAVTGQVVNRKFVNDLPLEGRDFVSLTFLAPGVVETNAPGTAGGTNFNSNGGRNSTADVLIDGATVTNFEQNSGLTTVPYEPSVDSVEEFKVQQNNFTAEYGFAGGTIINVVTRSGTNQFHGTLYEFLRNSSTDANEWFANKNQQAIPPLKRNNFGGVIGGPIRKDKTFFFFNYEGRRNRDFASQTVGVPTLCERGLAVCGIGDPNNLAAGLVQAQSKLGNFSELCTGISASFDANGQCTDPAGQLWDPYTGVFNNDPAGDGSIGPGAVRSKFIPFNNLAAYTSPGNANLNGTPFALPAGPGNLINPVASNMLAFFPHPTVVTSDLGINQSQNFSASGVTGGSNDQFDIKVDHRFSEADLFSVKYSQQKGSGFGFNAYKNEADPFTAGPSQSTRHLLAINHTHTFSPTLVLTVTYGGLRAYDNSEGIGGQFPNIITSTFTPIGFPSYLNRGFKTLPSISINGNYGTPIGSQQFAILRWGQETHHLGGAVSWIRGRHELKFGAEGRMHRINFIQPGEPSGAFNFENAGTSQITSTGSGGDAMASFLLGVGIGGGGSLNGFLNAVSTQSFRFAEFAQDNFRVNSKLTLNLGLRYELSLPRTERFNRMNWVDLNATSPLQLTAAQIAGLPAGLPASAVQTLSNLHAIEVFASPKDRSNYYTDYKMIQPRFGLAYQLPHAFVVRGGYGIYFSTPRSGAAGTGPWGYQGFQIQPPWNTTLPDRATPFNTLSNPSCFTSAPFTCADVPTPGNSLGAFNDIGNSAVGPIRSVSKNVPYEQTWSLGFQKELPFKVLFDASYVGKKGTHLYLGGFREHNFLPANVLQMSPAAISALNNTVPNPFFSSASPCDRTHYICDQSSQLYGNTTNLVQLMVPFPQYAGVQGDSPPIANSIYHALQVRVEKEFSHGLQFLVTYAWSKSIDNASATDDSFSFLGGGTTGGSTLGVQNPYDLRAERAPSVYDIPQIFQASYVYEFPLGRGKQFGKDMNAILNAVVGGWQTNGIVRIDTGRPIIPGLSGSLGAQSIPTFGQRPNLVGNLGRSSTRYQDLTDTSVTNTASYFANPGALSHTPADDFTLGTAPRTIGSVRQPGARDTSMSLFKEFGLGMVREGMRLEFRAESFNTFNHPHFQGPNANVGSNTYGKITSTLGNPRQLQFGLKLYF